MSTPEANTVIEEKILAAIREMGQLNTDKLLIIAIIIGFLVVVFYLRLRFKAQEAEASLRLKMEENDTRRTEENNKIFMRFAELFNQVVNTTDTATGQAITALGASTAKVADGMNDIHKAIENSTLSIENNTAVQVRQEEQRAELRDAMHQMVDQQKALRTDVAEWPSAVMSAVGILEQSVDELKTRITVFQEEITGQLAKCSERDDKTQLDILKDILAGINTLTGNQTEISELVSHLRSVYDSIPAANGPPGLERPGVLPGEESTL